MDAASLQQALAIADAADTVRDAASALRAVHQRLRVVVVDAFDMRGEMPAAIGERRSLYLGASDGHCWTVTTDPAQVGALFIADR
jgi:hypothetical protein